MKIGLVCPYSLIKGGGVQECVLAMQAELTRRGHIVYIITPQPRDHSVTLPSFVRALGRMADMKSPFHTTAQVSVSVDVKQVDRLLAAEQFDVLHFHEPWVPLLSRQLLLRSKSKNIATFHAKLPDTVMSRTIERVITPYTGSVLKYFNVLTAVSEPAATYVRSLTDQPVKIIPNGINLHTYTPSGYAVKPTKAKIKTILFVGRLETRKGLMYLLKAMTLLSQTKIKLIIAGEGPDRKKLEAYVEDHDLHNVQFKGFVDEATKIRLLTQADLFCSPALYGESFGIVLLEAMATGVVSVVGNNEGYMSLLQGRGALSIVNPKDTEEFARRIDILLHDEELRMLWRQWALQYVRQYDYQNIIDAYEKLYLRALKTA